MRKTIVVLISAMSLAAASKLDYPAAPKHPVTDTYGSVSITDEYRWLEDANAPETQQWVAAENRLTREVLDNVPGRAEIARRLDKILRAPRLSYYGVTSRAGKIFALKAQPPKE